MDRLFKGDKGGDWPRYVKGLADCALNHLNLEPEQVLNLKTRERLKKVNPLVVNRLGRITELLYAVLITKNLIRYAVFLFFLISFTSVDL